MKPKYLYYPRTGKLHIEGYCGYAKNCDCFSFATEAEARAFAHGSVSMCKKCQNKRDKLLSEVK